MSRFFAGSVILRLHLVLRQGSVLRRARRSPVELELVFLFAALVLGRFALLVFAYELAMVIAYDLAATNFDRRCLLFPPALLAV